MRAGTTRARELPTPSPASKRTATLASTEPGLTIAIRVEKKSGDEVPSARKRFSVPTGLEPAASSWALVSPSWSGSPSGPPSPVEPNWFRPNSSSQWSLRPSSSLSKKVSIGSANRSSNVRCGARSVPSKTSHRSRRSKATTPCEKNLAVHDPWTKSPKNAVEPCTKRPDGDAPEAAPTLNRLLEPTSLRSPLRRWMRKAGPPLSPVYWMPERNAPSCDTCPNAPGNTRSGSPPALTMMVPPMGLTGSTV